MKVLKNTLLTAFALFFTVSCNNAETTVNTKPTTESVVIAGIESDDIQVIQFHSEHRCMTCNKIESLTRETVQGLQNMPFNLINVDDVANESAADAFEAAGTALYLYNPKTGAKKDLTDFAFMHAGKDEDFKKGLAAEIEIFSRE
jgi:hypothetical protein